LNIILHPLKFSIRESLPDRNLISKIECLCFLYGETKEGCWFRMAGLECQRQALLEVQARIMVKV